MKVFLFWGSVRPVRLTIPARPARFSIEFRFGSAGSALVPARPVSGSVVAELMLDLCSIPHNHPAIVTMASSIMWCRKL